jgi:hypothetical protein
MCRCRPFAPAFIKARIGDAWRDREGYVVDDEFLRLGLAERSARIRLPVATYRRGGCHESRADSCMTVKISFLRRNFLELLPIEIMKLCVATTCRCLYCKK